MSFDLPADLERDLELYAEAEHISPAEAVVRFVEAGLNAWKRKAKSNPLTAEEWELLRKDPLVAFFERLPERTIDQMEAVYKENRPGLFQVSSIGTTQLEVSPELLSHIQLYADTEGLSPKAATDRIVYTGTLVLFSEMISARIPEPLRGFIVSDYHTVHGWARFKDTRLPLQCLVDSLLYDPTGDDFRQSYPDSVSEDDIETVQRWLATLPPSNYPDSTPEHFKFLRQMSDWLEE